MPPCECDAMEYGHWSTYKQTDPAPQADADIAAMDAGPKKAATEYKAAWTHKQSEAYYFVLRALDRVRPNTLVVKSECNAGDGLAAYLRMMCILADDSSASTMSLSVDDPANADQGQGGR